MSSILTWDSTVDLFACNISGMTAELEAKRICFLQLLVFEKTLKRIIEYHYLIIIIIISPPSILARTSKYFFFNLRARFSAIVRWWGEHVAGSMSRAG